MAMFLYDLIFVEIVLNAWKIMIGPEQEDKICAIIWSQIKWDIVIRNKYYQKLLIVYCLH